MVESVKSVALPIWITDTSRPVRAGSIDGMAELLQGLGIIRKLDITVIFGTGQFRVGQGGSGMMTYNGKHHWVFPLVPAACAYAKLNDYYWEL